MPRLQVPGGEACLLAMGFARDGDYLKVLGDAMVPPGLSNILDQITRELDRVNCALAAQAQPHTLAEPATPPLSSQGSSTGAGTRGSLPRVDPRQQDMFRQRITGQQRMMHVYERGDLQQKARDHIPMKQLLQQALTRRSKESGNIRDCLLAELLGETRSVLNRWLTLRSIAYTKPPIPLVYMF